MRDVGTYKVDSVANRHGRTSNAANWCQVCSKDFDQWTDRKLQVGFASRVNYWSVYQVKLKPTFLNRVITGDKTWFFQYDPERDTVQSGICPNFLVKRRLECANQN